MKKKLMFFVLATMIFCLGIVISIYVMISNYEFIQNIKRELMLNNDLMSDIIKTSKIDLKNGTVPFGKSFENSDYRLTIIDPTGKVVYDSIANPATMENHNTREEVQGARQNGVGYSIRNSKTIHIKMVYVAKKISGDYVLRSSISVKLVGVINKKYIGYYVGAIIIVLILTTIISSRLSFVIIKPIKDLEYVTSRITKGEMDRRVRVTSKDEIGQLGTTFNFMADKLQSTLKDSIEKQNKLEAILKSMDNGVVAIDRNNKIIMINPYAKKIFGIDSNKDIIGKKLMDGIRDFEIEEIINTYNEDYKEIKIFWPSEKTLRIKTADIVNANEHIGTVAVVQDITEIKKLESMRTEFVANVSHELKTPLTSIKGFAETLRDVEDSKIKEKFLDIINDEAERLTRLINDILVLSDLETHKEDKKETFDVNKVMDQVHELIKNTAEAKNISIKMELGKVDYIIGSVDRFKQMVINLVDNAVKYSENGGSVTMGSRIVDGKLQLWVEDTGFGIPKEHIPRLFERFYRVDKARSRAKGGTGLGLAIVKHIVIGMGGKIEVESELNKGSKFTVTIPYIRD
ncbi:HAMP domain-containing protein [Clostridium sp. 19966]|uniref:two-component system histidine kinase PnpS n=1 Tax=Clostridium sp. 19966 TaxID=2768166 RepID=UPI0028DEF036|nr:ATP-binding protein [Clostridium sp. 19966]MDT8718145.1 HAMP domain-containing protein [Clostridium sp. 19966]